MKRLYFLLFVVIVFARNIHTMEPEQSTSLEKPKFRDYVEYIGNILLDNVGFESDEFSLLAHYLPINVQNKIAGLLLLHGTGDTIETCAQTVSRLSQINKTLNELVKDPDFCLKFIKHLSEKFEIWSDAMVAQRIDEMNCAEKRFDLQIAFESFISNPAQFSIDRFKDFINKGVDLEFTSIYGFTPLADAIRMNNLQALSALLEHGAKLNYEMKRLASLKTPLLIALSEGNIDAVKILTQYGVDVNYPTSKDVLTAAYFYKQMAVIKGANAQAAHRTAIDMMKLLIAAGIHMSEGLKKDPFIAQAIAEMNESAGAI